MDLLVSIPSNFQKNQLETHLPKQKTELSRYKCESAYSISLQSLSSLTDLEVPTNLHDHKLFQFLACILPPELGTLLFTWLPTYSLAIRIESSICLPPTKPFWDFEINWSKTLLRRFANTLAKILYTLPTKLIGLKSLIYIYIYIYI